jgi:hypothetical protein
MVLQRDAARMAGDTSAADPLWCDMGRGTGPQVSSTYGLHIGVVLLADEEACLCRWRTEATYRRARRNRCRANIRGPTVPRACLDLESMCGTQVDPPRGRSYSG